MLLIQIAVRIAVANSLGRSNNIASVTQAAKLDGRNPEFQQRLGFLYAGLWKQSDMGKAVFYFRTATTLQPYKAGYWIDLGRACFVLKDEVCSNQSYENAVRLAPAIPRYQWEIANHYLLGGRQKKSLSHFRRFLELDPGDPRPTFRLCLRAFTDPLLIWQALLEGESDATLKLAYVSFLNESGSYTVAYQFWNEIVASSPKISFSVVQTYLDQLIANNMIDQASKIWEDIETLGVIPRQKTGDSANVVFNGSFEQEPLNAGFDWRLQAQQYLHLDYAGNDCYEGRRCLHVEFTVPSNFDCEPIYQIVPVRPNQRYALTAYARSANISSDSGPRVRVMDPLCPTCLSSESPSTEGTTPWHRIAVEFTTGPKTQSVRISIWRPRSRSFPMEIRGHFWLDSVSLTPSPAADQALLRPKVY